MTRPSHSRWFQVDQTDGITVVTFTQAEIVDLEAVEEVGEQLYKLIEYYTSSRIVLNLGCVRQVSSLVIGKLLGLNERVKAAGGRLVFCRVTPEVYQLFKLVNLLRLFSVYDSEEEAVRSFATI
jgi:anti-anti-sigma factor